MHTDDLKYCDPCIGLAVGDSINGEFTFQGPLLYQGKPLKMWDIGTFVDDDGTAYLLTHEGNIYRLSKDYTQAVELIAENIAPAGNPPPALRQRGNTSFFSPTRQAGNAMIIIILWRTAFTGRGSIRGCFVPKGA